MPTLVPMNMSFRTHCALFLIPGWGDVMGLPEEERMKALADPEVRAQLDERARSKEAGVFRGLSHWGTYVIGDTYAPANEGCAFRSVADIAAERGTEPRRGSKPSLSPGIFDFVGWARRRTEAHPCRASRASEQPSNRRLCYYRSLA